MKKILLLMILAFPFMATAQKPGQLISYEKNLDLTPSGVTRWLYNIPENEQSDIIKMANQLDYGLVGYKLTYYTTDFDGSVVPVTGEVLFPKTGRKLSQIIHCHETTLGTDFVPSNLGSWLPFQFLIPVLYSLNDYIVIAPDYIGYAESETNVRYAHAQTTGESILDMYDAAQVFLDEINLNRHDETFITGYSLGAHGGAAALKIADERGDYDFKYVSLGAGPYDMEVSTMENGVLAEKKFPLSAFLVFVFSCANDVGYNVFEGDWKKVIQEEYHDDFQKEVIEQNLGILWGPQEWRKVFNPSFITDLETNMDHPFRKFLRDNSVHDWYNKTPTRYMSGRWDKIIHPSNRSAAVDAQRSKYPWWDSGKYKIKGTDMGYWGHVDGLLPYLIISLYDFNSRRVGGFFNLRSGYRSNQSIELRKSSIRPELYLNDERIPSKLSMIEGRKRDYTKGAFIAKATVNREEILLPVMIDDAVTISNAQSMIDNGSEMLFDIKNQEIQYINVWRGNTLVTSQKTNSIDKGLLQADDIIEMVTEDTIFKTSYMTENQLFSAAANNASIFIKGDSKIKAINAYDTAGRLIYRQQNIDQVTHEFSTPFKGMIILDITDMNNQHHSVKVINK